MYVCVCNAVTDHQLRALVRRGVDQPAALQQLTGCGNCCGQCEEELVRLIESERGIREISMPMHVALSVATG